MITRILKSDGTRRVPTTFQTLNVWFQPPKEHDIILSLVSTTFDGISFPPQHFMSTPPSKTAIIDYEAGNLTSVQRAVQFLGGDGKVTRNPEEIRSSDRVIFPGVGAAGSSMESLKELGLDIELKHAVESGKPVLGICVGSQVILDHSAEDGGVKGLGFIPGNVVRFAFPEGVSRKIPHMGWNQVTFKQENLHPVFEGIESGTEFYFVHSYHCQPEDPSTVQGTSVYGEIEFTAALAKDNLVAVQFHAEKSGPPGLRIIKNFLEWNPS